MMPDLPPSLAQLLLGAVLADPGWLRVDDSGVVLDRGGELGRYGLAGLEAGAPSVVDRLFLPDVHAAVGNAIAGLRTEEPIESLGVIETRTTAGAIRAADAALKGARVHLLELRVANGLGGKALVLVTGDQADVEAAVELGAARVESGNLVQQIVIPRLHEEMADNLLASSRFAAQFGGSEG